MSGRYEDILIRMLNRVPDTLDKREGSVIFDSLAPCAFFLAQQKFQLDNFADLVLPDTALGDYLDRIVLPYDLPRKKATKAVRKMTLTGEPEIGSRWGINELIYKVTSKIKDGVYQVECETEGDIGNQFSGALQSVSGGTGTSAVLGDIISAGTETETDEALRKRLLNKLQKPSTSGNIYDYYNWAMACTGVGAAKIFPLASGSGTVKVVIANSNRLAADIELVKLVSESIEELRPIGATVSVVSAVEKKVNISAKIRLKNGINLGQAQEEFSRSVSEFLKQNAFDADYISLAKVGSLLLDIPGVEDFTELKLNGDLTNIILAAEEIAVAGDVLLEVISSGS